MSVLAFTTTRQDGPLREAKRLERFLTAQTLPTTIATAEQIHRAAIMRVPRLRSAKTYAAADGLLTDQRDQPLGIFTADCVPVFLSARSGTVVGVLHAGWRGVQQRIVPKALALLWRHWHIPAREVRLWAGPAIGSCCFEVQWDVARYFPGARQRRGQRWRVDLERALVRQVKSAGARWGKGAKVCTMHTRSHFSYRGGSQTERQLSLIMKRHDA